MSSRTSSEATAGLSHKRARSDDPGDASPPRRSAVAGPSRSTRRSEEPRSSSSGPAFSVGNPFKSIKRPRKRTAPPDLRDNDREPSTEEEEEDPAKQEQAVKADSEDDEEPSTAESGDEPIVAFGSRTLPARSSRNTAPVLDLTDSGDEGFSSLSPGLAYGSSSRPNALANGAADASSAPRPHLNIRPGDSLFGTLSAIDDDDDESLVFEDAAAVRAKRAEKGKGKARDASSPPVPLADSTSSANNAAATTADSRPLPSLSHLTCPICFGPPAPLALTSTPLYGGWGKSLRGLVLRMAPIKR
ncbi:zinc finger, RING-type domain containing protein [Rhodotorula toruloides]|uniref:Zinc finger, RING-type domain containing protein n=1 Tax=Rhodotorula toruloides TaxID=5286 RepID=A0A511KJS2_RHOTO|nr:zinc finger, RING-type domain containing protein [Rhodotorula toruloides]